MDDHQKNLNYYSTFLYFHSFWFFAIYWVKLMWSEVNTKRNGSFAVSTCNRDSCKFIEALYNWIKSNYARKEVYLDGDQISRMKCQIKWSHSIAQCWSTVIVWLLRYTFLDSFIAISSSSSSILLVAVLYYENAKNLQGAKNLIGIRWN